MALWPPPSPKDLFLPTPPFCAPRRCFSSCLDVPRFPQLCGFPPPAPSPPSTSSGPVALRAALTLDGCPFAPPLWTQRVFLRGRSTANPARRRCRRRLFSFGRRRRRGCRCAGRRLWRRRFDLEAASPIRCAAVQRPTPRAGAAAAALFHWGGGGGVAVAVRGGGFGAAASISRRRRLIRRAAIQRPTPRAGAAAAALFHLGGGGGVAVAVRGGVFGAAASISRRRRRFVAQQFNGKPRAPALPPPPFFIWAAAAAWLSLCGVAAFAPLMQPLFLLAFPFCQGAHPMLNVNLLRRKREERERKTSTHAKKLVFRRAAAATAAARLAAACGAALWPGQHTPQPAAAADQTESED